MIKVDLLKKISIATNKQKPIKEKDLISNSNEVISLSDRMIEHNPSLFLIRKRGQIIPNYLINNQVQKFTLDDVFQIITSFNFQLPGTTKNKKSKLWTDYRERIFSDIDLDQLYICNIIRNEIKKIRASKIRIKNSFNKFTEIYKTGSLFIFATINFFWKFLKNKDAFFEIFNDWDNHKDPEIFSLKFSEIKAPKIKKINNIDSSFSKNMSEIANIIVSNLYNSFNIEKARKTDIQFSNYTKVDRFYINFISHLFALLTGTEMLINDINNLIKNLFGW